MRTLIILLAFALLPPLTGCRKEGKKSGEFLQEVVGGGSGGEGGGKESGGTESKELREFSPPGGEYTVLMPGRVGPPARAPGKVKFTAYGAERAPGEEYVVGAGDIPTGTFFTLDALISELGAGYDGSNTWKSSGSERPDELWVTFQIQRKSGEVTSGRTMLVGRRFYLLFAIGPNTKLSNPDVRTFIDSFRLNGRPTPGPQQYGGLLHAPTGGDSPPVPLNEGMVGDLSPPTFRDEAPAGGMLVGLDVWYEKFLGEDTVCAVRPLYLTGDRESIGQLHGKETKSGARLLAKPGYAVGAIDARWGLGIDSLLVTFMKVNGRRLDPNDSYTEKAGGAGGGTTTKFGGDGNPIVGIIGRKKEKLVAFGIAWPPKR